MSNLDKQPWKDVEPPEGSVERAFLRRVALGESVGPYRLLQLQSGVIPMENGAVLTAASANANGHRGLAAWLRDAETKWGDHSNKNIDGNARMSLSERVDAMGMLRAQANQVAVRVLYTKSGTRLSACWLEDDDVVVDHQACWSAADTLEEAAYLAAIVNSRTVLDRVRDLQPIGQRDPKHFDNLVWTLPIPKFDPTELLHSDLAAAALHAASIAARVQLPDAAHFTTKRRLIRDALADDGVADAIEHLVDALLPP